MRGVILLLSLMWGAAEVYPESPVVTASRSTGLAQKSPAGSLQPSLLTAEQVSAWVKRWQGRLGLGDWTIETKIVRLRQLPMGTVANIHWSLPRKHATIAVLDPRDSTLPASEIVRDAELSVVHELIHLSMAKLPLDANNTELEEEAVKKISAALLALDTPADPAPKTAELTRNQP